MGIAHNAVSSPLNNVGELVFRMIVPLEFKRGYNKVSRIETGSAFDGGYVF
jgi:hypothetical protein